MFVRAARFKSSLEPNVTKEQLQSLVEPRCRWRKETDAAVYPYGTRTWCQMCSRCRGVKTLFLRPFEEMMVEALKWCNCDRAYVPCGKAVSSNCLRKKEQSSFLLLLEMNLSTLTSGEYICILGTSGGRTGRNLEGPYRVPTHERGSLVGRSSPTHFGDRCTLLGSVPGRPRKRTNHSRRGLNDTLDHVDTLEYLPVSAGFQSPDAISSLHRTSCSWPNRGPQVDSSSLIYPLVCSSRALRPGQ